MSRQVPAYELAETIEREMIDGFAFGYIGEAVAMLRKLQAENDSLKAVLKRYIKEVPLGNQPHMLAHIAEELVYGKV